MPKLPLALVLLAQAAIKYRAFRENGRAETDAMQPLPDAGWPQATLQGIRQGKQEGRQKGKQEGFASLLALQLKLRFSGADVGTGTSHPGQRIATDALGGSPFNRYLPSRPVWHRQAGSLSSHQALRYSSARAVQSWQSDACAAKVYMTKVPKALYLLA